MSEKFSRREFLKVAAGAATFLEACSNLKEEQIDALPMISLDDLETNPEKFASMENIKTVGYITEKGEEITHDEMAAPVSKYQRNKYETTSLRYHYTVSDKPGTDGIKVDAVSERKIVDYDINNMGKAFGEKRADGANVLQRDFPKLVPGKAMKIVGRVIRLRGEAGQPEKYVLEIGRLSPESNK